MLTFLLKFGSLLVRFGYGLVFFGISLATASQSLKPVVFLVCRLTDANDIEEVEVQGQLLMTRTS